MSGGITPIFFTSELDGLEWSAPSPCLITPGKRAPGTHRIGGWLGPRAGLDVMEKRGCCPCRESNSRRPARVPTELSRLSRPHTLDTLSASFSRNRCPPVRCALVTNEIWMNVNMKSYISWDIMPPSPLKINRRFGGTCCLHLRSWKISQTRNQREAGIYLLPAPRWFLAWLIILSWRRKHALSKTSV
jgi:hypothetical protein